MRLGGPILIVEFLKVDILASLFRPSPRWMLALDLDLHADLGCRRNVSIYAQTSGIALNEQTSDIRALRQCPSQVVRPLQVTLLIFHKQPQRKPVFWNVLQCNLCVWPKISGMA